MKVFPIPSTALSRLKRRVRWVEHGVETDVRTTEYGSYFRVHLPSIEDSKVFSNRCVGLGGGRYFLPSTAKDRLLTIQPNQQLPWRNPVTPSLQAVTSEPELVKVSGLRGYSVFSNLPIAVWQEGISPAPSIGNFFVPTSATLRIYQRYAVLNGSARLLRRHPVQFMGVGRYGFPAFTAWLQVTVGNRRCPWAAGFGFYLHKSKFWIPHNGEPTRQVRAAVVASKTLRDQILLQTGPIPRFVPGGTPVLADIDTVIVGRP